MGKKFLKATKEIYTVCFHLCGWAQKNSSIYQRSYDVPIKTAIQANNVHVISQFPVKFPIKEKSCVIAHLNFYNRDPAKPCRVFFSAVYPVLSLILLSPQFSGKRIKLWKLFYCGKIERKSLPMMKRVIYELQFQIWILQFEFFQSNIYDFTVTLIL